MDSESAGRRRRRTPLVVGAIYLAETAVIVAAVPRLAGAAPHPAHDPALGVVVVSVILAGATALGGSGLLLLATRHHGSRPLDARGGPGSARPGAALLGLAAYVAIEPAARLLDPGAATSLVGWHGRVLGVLLCVVLLLGGPCRPVRLLGTGVATLAVLIVTLIHGAPLLGLHLDAGAGTHLVLEVVLVAAWSLLALCLSSRGDLTIGSWPAWQLAMIVGCTQALRAVDGGPSGWGSLAAAVLLVGVAGRVLHSVWVSLHDDAVEMDVDRSRLEDELVAARHAVELYAERSEEIAHDTRNTCAAVRAAVELLSRDELDRANADVLRATALRGVQQLEQMLANRDEQTVEFDVLDSVAAVVEGQRLRGAHILVEETGTDPVLGIGRPGDVATIALNLLVNAHRHASGSAVRVVVERRGDQAVLTFSDSGPGVAPRRHRDLFERGVSGVAGGQGLGLHIARSLVRAQGGDLELVASTVGACFELRLPAAVPAGVESLAASTP